MIKYFKKTILQITLALFIAILLGMYILPFISNEAPEKLWAVLSGLAVISLAGSIRNAATAISLNFKLDRTMKDFIPKSADELRRIGVKTPVDFVYMMCNSTMYCPLSPFTLRSMRPIPVISPGIYKRGADMFQEMFGRKPLGYKSRDWQHTADCEVCQATGKTEEECENLFMDDLVTPEVREYLETELPRRLARISRKLRVRTEKRDM